MRRWVCVVTRRVYRMPVSETEWPRIRLYLSVYTVSIYPARAIPSSWWSPRARCTTAARRRRCRWVGRSLARSALAVETRWRRASAGTPPAANHGAAARSPAHSHAHCGQSIMWRERRGFKRRGAARRGATRCDATRREPGTARRVVRLSRFD